MRHHEVAIRYAKAIFQISKENKNEEQNLVELREIAKAARESKEISKFFRVSVVSSKERKAALEGLFQKVAVSTDVKGLLLKLAEKGRLEFLDEVVDAFQGEVDANHGIVRGEVRSAAPLWPEERKSLEEKISKYTGKKVVLEYHEDKSLIGGLVAQVGSFSFDDSLETQLRLMREDLKRKAN